MDEACDFLLDLEAALHSVSVPADITEQLITRASAGLGTNIELAIFQSYVAADVHIATGHEVRIKRIPFESHYDLWRTQELVDLAQAVGDGRVGLVEGRERLARIKGQRALYSKGIVVLGYGVYAGGVAARVGGNWLDAAAGVLVGLLAGLIHYGAGRFRSVDLQQSFIAGLAAAPLALALSLVLPVNAGKVMYAGISLLVPSSLLTIAVHEIANDALESGVLRFMYALLRFVMLGFGIAASLKLWHLFAPVPEMLSTDPLPFALVMALLLVGAVGLALCLQAPMRDLGWVIIAVLLAVGAQEATKLAFGDPGSPFAAAFVLGVAGQLFGRWSGRLPAIFVIPGLLQLTPGFLGTRAEFQALVGHRAGTPTATMGNVFLLALQLVTGLLIATVLFRKRPAIPELRPATTTRG